MTRSERMTEALARSFAPALVEVDDQSARHAGHAGSSGAGETHYDVRVVSDAFGGMSRIARQRAAQEVLAAEFASGLHALSLTLRTPSEVDGPAARA